MMCDDNYFSDLSAEFLRMVGTDHQLDSPINSLRWKITFLDCVWPGKLVHISFQQGIFRFWKIYLHFVFVYFFIFLYME